jgi:hypothetical protein
MGMALLLQRGEVFPRSLKLDEERPATGDEDLPVRPGTVVHDVELEGRHRAFPQEALLDGGFFLFQYRFLRRE